MGLPTAFLFAAAGHSVYGYDIDRKKIEILRQGGLPFEEKGMKELHRKARKNFSCGTQIQKGDIFIISVPTPVTNRMCENKYVISATKSVVPVLEEGNLVILESTVAPGTTRDLVKPILDKARCKYDLCYVSEKAIPGNTIYEMQHNHRIVGGYDKKSGKRTKELYSSIVKSEIHVTDSVTAESAKLMENTFRDVNIALANEFWKLSDELGIDVHEAISLANLHPRVNILNPGPGVGGHCIPIDPWFLTEKTKSARLIPMARQVNDSMPEYVFNHYIKPKVKKGDTVAILGVAYKPNVDDDRESPAYEIIRLCKEYGLKVRVHDPCVKGVEKDLKKVTDGADLVHVVTRHMDYEKFL
jgi:UDP-N-acetyl-D-mannosaminuronic acid dehydrogenase